VITLTIYSFSAKTNLMVW